MARLGIPNRRLTSKAVGNQLRATIVEEVLDKHYQVLTARLVWKATESSLKDAKRLICYKRNQCDSLIADEEGVMFLVSCLSLVQDRKRKRTQEPSQDLDKSVSSGEQTKEEVAVPVFPAINYWICYALPSHIDFEKQLFSKLLRAQLDISDIKLIRSRGKTNPREILTATLMTSVQDHNNYHVKEMLRSSLHYCTEQLMKGLLVHQEVPIMCDHDSGATNREFPMRIILCHESCREFLTHAVAGLQKLGCEVQVSE